MTFKPAQCPNCGGALQLPDDRSTVKCMYCGIEIVVREAIQAVAIGNVKNWLQIAVTAAQSGNYEEAYAFYTRILEVEGHNTEAWLGRAEAAGRMSTVQNSRLLEMITGIEKALDSATPEQRKDIEVRSSRLTCSIISSYYNSMRAQITPHLIHGSPWIEYINQIHKVVQVLERAHGALPKNEEIINLYLQLCTDNLSRKGIAYRNSTTGQVYRRHLPPNQKLWLQSRSEYYTNALLALRAQTTPHAQTAFPPQTPVNPLNKPRWLEELKLSTLIWIIVCVIGVVGVFASVLAILLSASVDNSQRSKEIRSDPSEVSTPSLTPSPSPGARVTPPPGNPTGSQEASAKRLTEEDLKRYGNMLREIDPDKSFITQVSPSKRLTDEVMVTVSQSFHYQPYQIRLQMAQKLWEAWARVHSPDKPDTARLSLRDMNGNEVGGSRALAGSLIWVQE